MRVAVMENNRWNLMVLTSAIHKLLPQALVKGFTDGNAALAWCSEHSSEVDLFFGNWWSAEETACGPEGANIISLVAWKKRPQVVLCAGDEMFRRWSYQEGADGFLLRPVTVPQLRQTLEGLEI